DLGLPFVAIGLLYRQGYLTQAIDGQGHQIAHYVPTDFGDLPVSPALDQNNNELHVQLELPGQNIKLKVWQAKAGHIRLFLLDSDLPENSEEGRRITYQLYGGDINTRIQQEIALGIGGVRVLRALGLEPTAWHINEGHAAFMVLERCREHTANGMNFDSALELVASSTVFTTHTPVPAGHDIFDHDLFSSYFKDYASHLGASLGRLMELGASPSNQNGFNMTALALRGSRFHNGVSRIHGGVASQMESYVWPQIPPKENPIKYVTNGVHVPTFLARDWANLFDMRFDREWRNELLSETYWERINDIPDQSYWSVRQTLKADLLEEVQKRAIRQFRRNGCSEVHIERLIRHLSPSQTDVLTLGFARRFATYKRATLLFSDPARLGRLLTDSRRPVLLIFAGKAHPSDLPGQELIRTIHEFSQRPEFEGKIILLENYDLALARKLVTGVDVWLNTPRYPLEASGTSGEKAGINGVINLSVLDGWWDEGYNGENGWAITPHGPQYDPDFRDTEESEALLDILERHVVPLYYNRNGHGYSDGWVHISKASMKSLMPHFNAQRMVMDYVRDYYAPASKQHRILSENKRAPAEQLSQWKKLVTHAWHGVKLTRMDNAPQHIRSGDILPIRVLADLNGLHADDVIVECLLGTENELGEFEVKTCFYLDVIGESDGKTEFHLDLCPSLSGLQYYKIRMYPYHKLLSHHFETGCMIWL
ncbi:MAG: alpha-glucan family phosphorylase, partial [Gammaproteobacteria bacterium]|nr:alpha-glucan family phosphorylase [Gammaproteobacteria bacterium]